MNKQAIKINFFALVGAMIVSVFATSANAQFNKAVVLLRGTVTAMQTGKPCSVRVSVREAGNSALEITGSTSNSESGNYLVVLKPGTKYWVHLEGDSVVTKDELVETPICVKTVNVEKDFSVELTSVPAKAIGDAKE